MPHIRRLFIFAFLFVYGMAQAEVATPVAPVVPSAPQAPVVSQPPTTSVTQPTLPSATTTVVAPSNESSRSVSSSDLNAANSPEQRPLKKGMKGAAVLRLQILLDRANFSSGEIDGSFGQKTVTAIAGYQTAHKLPVTGKADAATWQALNAEPVEVLTNYTVANEDVAGPFEPIPEDMEQKSKLNALGFVSPLEGLAEKFHASPKLLQQLNPGKSFDRAGEVLLVPNVASSVAPVKAARVVVTKSDKTVRALAADGTILAQFPASMGSAHDPLPLGHWKIKGVAKNPLFHYNPALFWDANPSHSKAKIPPGPNNPVGVAWIDLSKEHYGIHGTPEPSKISLTQSHGCIRLTNWDVQRLSHMVSPGVPADLEK